MASSCRGSPLPSPKPLSAPVLSTARRSLSIFSRQGSVRYDLMPQHISTVVRTTPKNRKMSARRRTIRRRPSKRVSILQALPPADTISPTTPIEVVIANQPMLSALSEQRHPLERLYPSSECLPLSAAALERGGPSPHSPLAKEEHRQRIGVWREGVANWNMSRGLKTIEEKNDRHARQPSDSSSKNTPPTKRTRRNSRPTLSVVIPGDSSPKSKALKTRSRTDCVATSTTPAISKFNMTAHILPSAKGSRRNRLGFTSPLADDDEVDFPLTAPAVVTKSFTPPPPLPVTPPSNPSRTSSTSSSQQSYVDSDESSYSNKSSRTSLDSSDYSRTRSKKSQHMASKKSKKSTRSAYTVMDPSKAGVFEEPVPNLNKSLPPSPSPEPELFDPNRSWTSIPKPRKSMSNASFKHIPAPVFQKPYMRPTNPINWKPIVVKSSKSCRSLHKLDVFDNEFMKTDPYNSSTPTSPTLSEAVSELNDKLCEIKPLQIGRRSNLGHQRSVSYESALPSTEDEFSVPTINVTRTGSDSSTSTVPSIPPKSAMRQVRRASEQSDMIMSPTASSVKRLSETLLPKISALKIPEKSSRRRSGSDLRKDSLAELRIPTVRTPVTAKHLGSPVPQLPMLSPVPRLLSPCTPSARISILIPSSLAEENTTSLIQCDELWQPATPTKFQTARAAAENALLHIMASLMSLDDLANTAVINKGMRRVYKQNELSLLKSVLQNESAAAWELREWSPPPSPENSAIDLDVEQTSYTAITYKSHALRDRTVVSSLKPMIVERCETFLRAETVSALRSKDDPNAARFDEAFYRIWCFCTIFGSGKHRDEDITGQLDWLKGGLLAHAQGCAATVNTNLEFDMSSVLLNPPEHFGICNDGGLSADELYDITELWNCLTALLQPYVGKTAQARTHGIFNGSKIKRGDVDTETVVLEEWIFHVLTLGPAAVLKLAEMSDNTNSGFALAAINGWMDWTPPAHNSSRGPFLREPVCRLYEERMAQTDIPSTLTPKDHERKENSRKRVANLAAEIRAARCSSSYKRLPLIDMATERPMSLFSRASGASSSLSSSRASVASSVTLVPRTPLGAPAATTPLTAFPASPALVSATSASTYSQPGTATWQSSRKVSPIAEEEMKVSPRQQRVEQQSTGRGSTESFRPRTNSADIAIQNVAAMGFTPKQAREALKITDRGDGLHVDRAVDWLLRHSPI